MAFCSTWELDMKIIKNSLFAVITLFLCVAIAPGAQAGSKIVSFGKGKSSTTISGKIKGNDSLDYIIRASAGQTLIVDIKGGKPTPYFNIMPPGSTWETVFTGSSDGSHFKGVLDKDGDWVIRVYQMGDAKDAKKTNSFKLNISIPPSAKSSSAATDSGTAVAEKACLAAVAKQTNVPVGKLKIKEVLESEAGIGVFVNVPDATAPWKCLTGKNGRVDGVEFTGSEGKL
jgi:hypothetical protein